MNSHRPAPRPHTELSATDDKFLFMVPRPGSGWTICKEWLDAGCPDAVYLDNSPDAQRRRDELDARIAARQNPNPTLFEEAP